MEKKIDAKFRNMQQQAEEKMANQGVKHGLAVERALERQARMPQLTIHPGVEDTSAVALGGGRAGLRRVVGASKKHAKEESDSESDSDMEGGARALGKAMYEHLAATKGEKYARRFMKGGFGTTSFAPQGTEVDHATMVRVELPGAPATAGTLPKEAIAPKAYGGVPQAPAEFRRGNDIAFGVPQPFPSAMAGTGKPKRTSARGVAIARNMKEKGLSLPEASKWLKEHPQ